jgi:hypothetical protein
VCNAPLAQAFQTLAAPDLATFTIALPARWTMTATRQLRVLRAHLETQCRARAVSAPVQNTYAQLEKPTLIPIHRRPVFNALLVHSLLPNLLDHVVSIFVSLASPMLTGIRRHHVYPVGLEINL